MSKASQREGSLYPIYTALNIPTVTALPSPKCIQWSPDGQLCFTTKNAAYLLTPDHGINFDNDSVVRSTPSKDDPALGWFKTMIQTDKSTPMRWPDYSQVWGAVSLGSIDIALISVAISPRGLSAHGGCIFATLTSNMDLNLWTATKNYLKGEWIKIFEIAPYLLNIIAPEDEDKTDPAVVLQAQIVCIEWTSQVDFGITPTPCLDASLLILGSRAGYLTFLRYRKGEEPEYVGTLSVAEVWITHVALAGWNIVEPGHYEGQLAYGTSDGTVGLVKITQKLRLVDDRFSFVPRYTIETTFEQEDELVYGPQGNKGMTSMRWVLVPGRSPILVSSTPGLIKLWSAPSPPSSSTSTSASEQRKPHWTSQRTLRLQTQRTSLDSSAFHPLSGLAYLPNSDTLVLSLWDGSFHAIREFGFASLEKGPTWGSRKDTEATTEATDDEINAPKLTCEGLSAVARTMFERSEKESGISKLDMVRVAGMMGYDGAGVMTWVYESTRPSDFSYKHDAKHNEMLVVARVCEEAISDDQLLSNLSTLLNTAKTSSAISPLNLLRPTLLHLRNPVLVQRVHTRLLELLRPPSNPLGSGSDSSNPVLPTFEGADELTFTLMEEMREEFKIALRTHLFGWDELLRLRMRLSLADFAWKLAANETNQTECGVVAQALLSSISQKVLRTLIRHVTAVVGALTAADLPFVSRLVVQSMLAGSPADIMEEGRKLSLLVRPLIRASKSSTTEITGEGEQAQIEASDKDIVKLLLESCPACGVVVPLEDITSARCRGGHAWARCSVTTFILCTPWVRTCVGCSRKAFLPPSAMAQRNKKVEDDAEAANTNLKSNDHLPAIARGWVVEELLEAVQRCLFCGNAFVGIL
ncbi:hypothetical protein NLJ89_g4210 [Agrocybe chaxingu]|uniref:Transcription factor IIIC 90kDa subunit N-terminal domain-containing protein n=1 Tax=Agrocybe chaxingu TaxID=84603 RepID=A0A9W8MXW3_9AGAR|nr:hypothetical protein NLJ89_g4210 [Agrocybe chaxingu]